MYSIRFLVIGDSVRGGKNGDPDGTGIEFDFLASRIPKNRPGRLRDFGPGTINGNAVHKDFGLAGANVLIEEMFFQILKESLFGILNYHVFE